MSGHDFECSFLEGPTAALIHFRTLWDKRASSIIHANSDLCNAVEILTAHLARSSSTNAPGTQTPPVRPGSDVWDALVASELPLLLEDIMAEGDLFF